MKITVVLDQERLHKLMQSTELDSPEAAAEYALLKGERAASGRVPSQDKRTAQIKAFYAGMLPTAEYFDALNPDYDLTALRELEKPLLDVAAH